MTGPDGRFSHPYYGETVLRLIAQRLKTTHGVTPSYCQVKYPCFTYVSTKNSVTGSTLSKTDLASQSLFDSLQSAPCTYGNGKIRREALSASQNALCSQLQHSSEAKG